MGESENMSIPWKLLEREVSDPLLTSSGNNILSDEIRTHPLGAEMNTFTYLPGIGQWSKIDVRNQVVYFFGSTTILMEKLEFSYFFNLVDSSKSE